MIEFTLLGQIPSGKNAVNITRTGHRYPSKRFSTWRGNTQFMVPKLKIPMDESLSIAVNYWPGDLRRRDAPGMLDALLHLFEYCGLVKDDKHFIECHWKQRGLDRTRPRCEIRIEKLSTYSSGQDNSTCEPPACKDL